ncbi:hypothetical protein [Burkholderia sp. Ac-20379]|uniref:hypothetical protein n=1 Tax=Burkholderia sp. Ac-20379 TaxID=2703900 RepID=UPI00197F385B|nr:hypothetical protein [Burkholderia sp. Ac-20379]MBN3723137.1 hypothetical protein [Burkholderia sp. Ac-20379]
MGKLIVFLILGFIAYSVLKQILKVARLFEPRQRQERQLGPEMVDVATPQVGASKTASAQDWADEVKRSYELFKAGALTKEEFENVKAQLLEKVGAEI